MSEELTGTVQRRLFSFGSGFLNDHVGHIISDPQIAVIELIANSYDAGGKKISISWPDEDGGSFVIEDDGTGMTDEELERRWTTLCYNRTDEQGPFVVYPPGVKGRRKKAFGKNGKGRHAALCFSDAYQVETWKDGLKTKARIEIDQDGNQPFKCDIVDKGKQKGHGTRISTTVHRNRISIHQVRECVGSKFLVDPDLSIFINQSQIDLFKLESLATSSVQTDHGEILIHQITPHRKDRTTQFHGITWWVDKRMVGYPSWEGLDGNGSILDGRSAAAKKLSYVVEADCLSEDVKDDWRGFHASRRRNEVADSVRKHIIGLLGQILACTRKEKKKEALVENREALRQLPTVSRKLVGKFVDQVQQNCPNLSQGDLVRTVEVFANFEKAKSGYDLLNRLASCSPDDIDTWNQLMQEWTASAAEVVLSELQRRLNLIEQLQRLVHAKDSDELHDLHPLFEKGLWIFGPEYDAVEFTSNRGIASVIRNHFGTPESAVSTRRPDIVATPNSTIGAYTSDSYDSVGEVDGIRKVLVVELKKGGFAVTVDELRQGEDYVTEIRKGSLVRHDTEIIVYVLGSSAIDSEERKVGSFTIVKPMVYDTLLSRAHARTFNLQKKLESVQKDIGDDQEVEEVLSEPEQGELLHQHSN
ncbi:MAG: ATP-binding protein [Candidatus Omnitrophica bacterium]|nr:ATP-binding protein [Candidatus Omnitrophota bacterium]